MGGQRKQSDKQNPITLKKKGEQVTRIEDHDVITSAERERRVSDMNSVCGAGPAEHRDTDAFLGIAPQFEPHPAAHSSRSSVHRTLPGSSKRIIIITTLLLLFILHQL